VLSEDWEVAMGTARVDGGEVLVRTPHLLDRSAVEQLARQELIRRGLEV
jgi:hypothetical protein